MANPMLYGGTQPNRATSPVAAVNNLAPGMVRQKNTFDLTHQRCQTERFADLTPFFVMNCVGNDDISMSSNIDQRPQSTFASPLMSTFRKHRGYFAVPRSVIYKELWQQVFVNPKKGEDIDFENVVCNINFSSFYRSLSSFWASARAELFSGRITESNIQKFVGFLLLYRHLTVCDSALSYLDLSPFALRTNQRALTDKWLDNVISTFEGDLSDWTIAFQYGDAMPDVRHYDMSTPSGINAFFDDCLSESFDLGAVSISGAVSGEHNWPTGLAATTLPSLAAIDKPVNIERLISYQMVRAQFFTSDDVDNVFTSNLWYQNAIGVAQLIFNSFSSSYPTFTWNGITLPYHPYSGAVIKLILTNFTTDYITNTIFEYFINLFQSHHSLRYGDMFNASRLEPLAVGDYSAAVSDNMVSAVDITQSILMQRFLNDVNASRNTIEGYNKLLYGVSPDDAPTEPRFVAHSVVEVGANLVANTGENQGNLETNLVLHDGRSEFSIHLNQDTILLGISWYDCIQLYANPLSPFALHIDRFDSFNPYLQNIGDQPVPMDILPFYRSHSTGDGIFGYLQNDFEYKQEINRAYGGYVNGALSGVSEDVVQPVYSTWAFIRRFQTDQDMFLSSDFIRNRNWEFDVFYKSLTGTFSRYFHFVCSYVNEVLASRPMEFVSGILFNGTK